MSTNQIRLDRLEARLGVNLNDLFDLGSLTDDERTVLSLVLAWKVAADPDAAPEKRQASKVRAEEIEAEIRAMARKPADWLAYYAVNYKKRTEPVDYVPPVGGADCDFDWDDRPDTLQRRHDLWALPEIRELVGDPLPAWLARSSGSAERALARFDALIARANAVAKGGQ